MQNSRSSKGRNAGRPPAASRRGISRILIVVIVLGVLAIGAGGTFLGISLIRSASPGRALEDDLKRADYYAGKGEYEEALKILNTLSFDDPKVKAALDDVLARKKAADDAAKQSELAALKEQQDQLKAGLAQLGDTLKGQQKIVVQPTTVPEDASAKEKALQKQVNDLMQKGADAFNNGRYGDARKLFEQAVALAPDNAEALAFAGASYLGNDPRAATDAEKQKATELSKKAAEKDPTLWRPHKTLGDVYNSAKMSDEALKEYATAARLGADDADMYYALGNLQYRASLFSDALKSYDTAVRIRPGFTNAHFNRGLDLEKLGDAAKALDSFRAAVATKKDFADAHYKIGTLLAARGDGAGALEEYKLATQYAPTNAGFLSVLGKTYMDRGDYVSAEANLSKSLGLDAESSAANANMALVKIRLGKPRDALSFAQKAVARDPKVPDNNFILGLANDRIGNLDDAARYYGDALQLNPKHSDALTNLGALYEGLKMPDRALPLLLTALEIAPESFEVHNNLGNVYLDLKRYQDSITQLSKALSIKADPTVEYNLGLAYAENGQTAEAKSAFVDVLAKDPSNMDVYVKLARIFIKEGNNKDARDLLTKLIARNPKPDIKEEAQKLLDQLK